jgi:hypothetical protein
MSDKRMDYDRPFKWPKGQRWSTADHLLQDGVVFKWNEIDIRYRPTTDDPSSIEWEA